MKSNPSNDKQQPEQLEIPARPRHFVDCPYGCDDFGWLENPFAGGAERCPYCG